MASGRAKGCVMIGHRTRKSLRTGRPFDADDARYARPCACRTNWWWRSPPCGLRPANLRRRCDG
ncbi:hypothetical protein F511_47611 [Dorcoceras hygrometricum]|uniref:Uncharacterized protein n=1 Tax=Dorcoceras hygrometricum TaxID=472368 RepID=A0A2Z6ZQM9_9LAMI|nr:hypothetical protein F511_47611 [Dorcoceras hygrometricum]